MLCGVVWSQSLDWDKHAHLKGKIMEDNVEQLHRVGLLGGRLAVEAQVHILKTKLIPKMNSGRVVADVALAGTEKGIYKKQYAEAVRKIVGVGNRAPLCGLYGTGSMGRPGGA